ncbi:MAG: peptide deformylase [Pseudomonadota bacterium]|nr:peptide deformylase [Pseudomonadota bacterium]
MALLNILVYPDPRLRQKAKPVERFDDELRRLVEEMAETMYAAPGIGLAAVQVNVPQRVLVLDLSEEKNDLKVFVNPEIEDRDGTEEIEEGCLSVPGVYASVPRADWIKLKAQDIDGKPLELEAEGLLAVCIQHEIDHLDGKMFVDYLSRLKQDRIRKKLQKEARQRELEPVAA